MLSVFFCFGEITPSFDSECLKSSHEYYQFISILFLLCNYSPGLITIQAVLPNLRQSAQFLSFGADRARWMFLFVSWHLCIIHYLMDGIAISASDEYFKLTFLMKCVCVILCSCHWQNVPATIELSSIYFLCNLCFVLDRMFQQTMSPSLWTSFPSVTVSNSSWFSLLVEYFSLPISTLFASHYMYPSVRLQFLCFHTRANLTAWLCSRSANISVFFFHLKFLFQVSPSTVPYYISSISCLIPWFSSYLVLLWFS